jgi:hypothetical protein
MDYLIRFRRTGEYVYFFISFYRRIEKYTYENTERYKIYLRYIQNVDTKRLKYCDESSFNSRELRPKRAVSMKGTPAVIQSFCNLSARFSVFMMTTPFLANVCFVYYFL